jgi:polysaccharide biosynthesis/export protein
MIRRLLFAFSFAALCLLLARAAFAQEPVAPAAPAPNGGGTTVSGSATVPASATAPGSVTASGGTTAPASSTMARDPRAIEYLIGPEDILDIQVWKNVELSRTVPVRPDGKISLPLVNDIQAAGLTPTDLRQQITERLGEYVPAAEVAVIVREIHSARVSVMGQVKMPGRYEVKSPATVLELIAQAQGLTEFAAKNSIVVLRQNNGQTTRMPFNYRKAAEGSEQENFFVRPGDIIFVP